MQKEKPSEAKFFEIAYKQMLKNNPNKELTHPIEDFVIENFLDRLRVINRNVDSELAAIWFFNKRDKGN